MLSRVEFCMKMPAGATPAVRGSENPGWQGFQSLTLNLQWTQNILTPGPTQRFCFKWCQERPGHWNSMCSHDLETDLETAELSPSQHQAEEVNET